MRKKILFVAEAATLAHLARPVMLANSLASKGYEVFLAADSRFDFLFPKGPFRRLPLNSISSEQFIRALAKGAPLYDRKTLQSYVEEDLRVIDQVQPELIIGDFRLSLSISARLAKVPYMTVSNIYWSPYASQSYTVPDLPVVRLLGVKLGQIAFDLVRPLAFALHSRPLNSVREHYGFPSLGSDLRRVYTDADVTLYADPPGLLNTRPMPDHHRYIGPVTWSPDCELPVWWNRLDGSRPIIYVTLGSSGNKRLLPRIIETLAMLPVEAIIATAGVREASPVHPNIHIADYLPGEKAAALASLVICNGGSPTAYQALANGCPVIGIPGNLDQYLNMTCLENNRLGVLLRSDRLSEEDLRAAIQRLLDDPSCLEKVRGVQELLVQWRPDVIFPTIVEECLAKDNANE